MGCDGAGGEVLASLYLGGYCYGSRVLWIWVADVGLFGMGESSRFLLCTMVVMIVSSLECDMINLYAIIVCCFKCAFIVACD